MKIFYLRDRTGLPVTCVVSGMKLSGIVFAVSTYNPIDVFSKRIAREVATGRLAKEGGEHLCAGNNVKQRLVRQIAVNDKLPTRTRLAAKLWLKNAEKSKPKAA
jgi:hypothetical protein